MVDPSATTIIDCKKTCVKFRASGSSEALKKKSKLGSEASKQLLVEKTLIGESLKRMCNSDRKSLNVKYNCAYYLAKHERPYSDYPILLSLHEKNRVKVGTSYLNDRAATNFTYHIQGVNQKIKIGATKPQLGK